MRAFIRQHWPMLFLFLTMVVIAAFPAEWQHALRYDVDAIGRGEVWRLWTANLAHTNWAHVLLNSVGLLVIWTVFHEQVKPSGCWLLFIAIVAPIHLFLLYLFVPELKWYVGLSGVLHGWLAAAAIMDIRARYWVGYLLFAALLGKLSWEYIYGASEQVKALIHAEVATQAHISGALVGAIVSLLWPRCWCGHCRGESE